MDPQLDAVRSAPTILDAIRLARELEQRVAGASPGAGGIARLEAAADGTDDALTAIAAIHALGHLGDDAATALLVERLTDPRAFVREHAIGALVAGRGHSLDQRLLLGAVRLVVEGGLTGMLAQLAVERLASRPGADAAWARALQSATGAAADPVVRARLVETLGLVPGEGVSDALVAIAGNSTEGLAVRAAALGALGDRREVSPDVVRELAPADGSLGAIAALAVHDLEDRGLGGQTGAGRRRIAQLFLHAELDAELLSAGVGDTGGIATLLVRLGDSLLDRPEIDGVVTISGGPAAAALTGLASVDPGAHAYAPVVLPEGVPAGIGAAWPGLVAARRGIRRALRAHGPIDRLHLRMADVGSLAGSMVARAEGIETVFSLAPDPHALIAAREAAGTLDRASFGPADAAEHLWFRVRLVARLTDEARRVVLFPRPGLRDHLRAWTGIDIAADPDRYVVVPEGVDTAGIARARAERPMHAPDVERILGRLPEDRRGLPLLVTVGRLADLKGMARVTAAWAADPGLRETMNLVVVGGDLDRPSTEERAELDRIGAVLAVHPDAARGLVLAGHQPNQTVARLLVAAERGHPGLAAAGGVYVCGSRKEEFGLAIVEALGTGLPVVAPRGGGPATYVSEDLGVLVDTSDPAAIAAGIRTAVRLSPVPGRAERARRMVAEDLTIDAMADAMADVYTGRRAARRDRAGERVAA
jgi:glycosyltransferase involved in cell wall biosynthesis